MNLSAGMENPRSWKVTKETTYPGWSMGKSSPPGTRHSSASVRAGSIPATTSHSSYVGVTVERCQFDMVTAEINDQRGSVTTEEAAARREGAAAAVKKKKGRRM